MVLFTACQDDDNDCGDTYFWSMGRKSALQTVKDKILVVYKADNEEKLKEELAKNGLSLTNITLDYILIHLDEVSETDRQLLSDCKKATIETDYRKIKPVLPYVVGWSYYYRWVEKDRELIPSIVISLRLKNEKDRTKLEKLAEKRNVHFIGAGSFDTLEFVCTKDSKCNPLEMANIFYESGLCEFSAPRFGGLGQFD